MGEISEPRAPSTDLLGDPWRPIKDRRGRKKRRFLDQDYEKVQELVAGDMTQEEIAAVMGCDEKTLRKYFSRELDEGHARLKAEALGKLREMVQKGNVSAIKAMLAVLDKSQLGRPSRRATAPPKEAPLGKKARLEKEAGEPEKHGGWADLLH